MKKITYSFFLLCSLFIIACGGDDTPVTPAPSADFSFDIDGKTVTFTNSSTDGSTYSWDFGDGESSTEQSPSHTYAANGSYVAKLTTTNETGSDEKQAVLEIINVGVDGSFDDWSDIPVAITPTAGTITSVKFENLENNKLFVYVEGTDALTPQAQILMDVDNDRSTGANITWFYFEGGEDLLIEGSLPINPDQAGSIYDCAPCDGSMPGEWNWAADPSNSDIASFMESSEMVALPGGGLAYEMAIDLTALGKTVSSEAIGIAVFDVDLASWAPVGFAPDLVDENTNIEGTMYRYTFK